MNWYLGVLKNYATFNGRAHRTEYWMFFLINILVSIALAFIDGVTGMTTSSGYGVLSGLYSLAILIPALAVGARRLHDTGRSGLWLLVGFVPCIGFLVLLFFLVQDSHPGSNQYGANPKGE